MTANITAGDDEHSSVCEHDVDVRSPWLVCPDCIKPGDRLIYTGLRDTGWQPRVPVAWHGTICVVHSVNPANVRKGKMIPDVTVTFPAQRSWRVVTFTNLCTPEAWAAYQQHEQKTRR